MLALSIAYNSAMRTWSFLFLLAMLMTRNLPAQDDCGPGMVLGPPDPRYHDDKEIAAELLTLQNTYPGLARRVELQKAYAAPRTHEGRVIYALKISDNVALNEDEPAVLIVSNHHARELITPEIALDLGKRLLSGYGKDPAVTARVNANEIWICPTFNPDGLAYVFSTNPMWRKNRRNNGGGAYGVDLNRNYPFHFGLCGYSTNPRSDLYQGPSAASEPETKTMIAFSEQERFAKVMDFHSYARDVRKPYGCNLCPPPPLCNYYISIQAKLASLANYATRNSCCGGGTSRTRSTATAPSPFSWRPARPSSLPTRAPWPKWRGSAPCWTTSWTCPSPSRDTSGTDSPASRWKRTWRLPASSISTRRSGRASPCTAATTTSSRRADTA